MKKYLDEEILRKREELKKEKFNSLEGGYYIDGKVVGFQKKEIMNCFSILVPDIMGIMPEQFARIKYPSEFRPQVILTTLNLSTNIGFSLFYRSIELDEIENLSWRMEAAIKRDHPDYRFQGEQKMKKVDGYRFSFRSHALDDDLFNLMSVVHLKRHTALVSFNCLYKKYKQWEEPIVLMLETIHSIEGKEI